MQSWGHGERTAAGSSFHPRFKCLREGWLFLDQQLGLWKQDHLREAVTTERAGSTRAQWGEDTAPLPLASCQLVSCRWCPLAKTNRKLRPGNPGKLVHGGRPAPWGAGQGRRQGPPARLAGKRRTASTTAHTHRAPRGRTTIISGLGAILPQCFLCVLALSLLFPQS